MKILMTGSTGLVGTALISLLEKKGHRVSPLVRGKPRAGTSEIEWHPDQNSVTNRDALEGHDAAIYKVVGADDMRGAVNIVAPNAVTNADFTETLGRVLERPAFFSVPAFAVRLAFGEMADAALLASQRVAPAQLKQHGFEFQYPQLDAALRHLLDK